MPCPEMSITRHMKRTASDIDVGPECSTDSLDRFHPGNLSLPSLLSGSMKRMKIHENDNETSLSTLSPSLSFNSLDCDSHSCNTDCKFLHNSYERNCFNSNISTSASLLSLSQHPFPAVIESIFGLDNQGNNQLHWNILRHNTDKALKLIKQAPSFDYLSIENAEGQTALHLAAETNQPSLARSLICAGAAVDAVDSNSNTPLHLACKLGYLDVVQCLLRPVEYTETLGNRYKIPFQRIPQNMELTDDEGKTCLELAVNSKHFKVAEMLLDAGAFILSPELSTMMLEKISSQLGDESWDSEDDDNEEENSKLGSLPFQNRHEESDNEENRRKGGSPFLEHDDHLSDRDLSLN